jgi:hypothetical protein
MDHGEGAELREYHPRRYREPGEGERPPVCAPETAALAGGVVLNALATRDPAIRGTRCFVAPSLVNPALIEGLECSRVEDPDVATPAVGRSLKRHTLEDAAARSSRTVSPAKPPGDRGDIR